MSNWTKIVAWLQIAAGAVATAAGSGLITPNPTITALLLAVLGLGSGAHKLLAPPA